MARRLVAVGIFVIVSVFATGNWLFMNPFTGAGHKAHFENMIMGTEQKPFVTRALVPWSLRVVGRVLPPHSAEGLKRPLRWAGLQPVFFPDAHEELDPIHFFVWVYLVVASLSLLGIGMWHFLATIYRGSEWTFIAGAAVTIAIWPLLAGGSAYIYDPFTPTLVLWTYLVGIRRSWAWYYPLLALAALNKETAILVPIAVAYCLNGKVPRRATLRRLAIDLLLVAAIRLLLGLVVFGHNPGQLLEFHLLDHNLRYELIYLFLPKLSLLLVLVVGLCAAEWGRKPREAKALALLAVPLVGLALIAACVDEIRQYTECYPGLMAMAFPTVLAAVGRDAFREQVDRNRCDRPTPAKTTEECSHSR